MDIIRNSNTHFVTYYFIVALTWPFPLQMRILQFFVYSTVQSVFLMPLFLFSSVTACNISLNKINGAVKKSPMPFILSSIWYAWTSLKLKFPFGFTMKYLTLDSNIWKWVSVSVNWCGRSLIAIIRRQFIRVNFVFILIVSQINNAYLYHNRFGYPKDEN